MKRLLFQFDTDPYPSTFDVVVAYDGGADQVVSYGAVSPAVVGKLVEGTIFTRAPKDKRSTAIFIGGSDLTAGQQLLTAVQAQFFSDFRVSVMLDCNGCNTTAAAAVAKLRTSSQLAGKKAVILAGTGPVGQRAAAMLAAEGALVTISSRHYARAEAACHEMHQRFGVHIEPMETTDRAARAEAIAGAQIVFATGAAGVALLRPEDWIDSTTIELLVDANTTPPLGIGGTSVMDRGKSYEGKIVWGAIGFGAFKLALHRACIARLFERNDQVFDAEAVYSLAKEMA
jgi:hypothetical protein